jgi:hypothetical protein
VVDIEVADVSTRMKHTRARHLFNARLLGMLTATWLLLAPAPTAGAAITTFGSSLRARATLTTNDLAYAGINTPYGRGVVHTAHFGADTALWNRRVSAGAAAAPAAGQVVRVSIVGCAVRARSGPPPLTQIHFQALAPVRGGGKRVLLTSQGFDLPVCGQRGAGGRTISTYRPAGLCVDRGDFIGFNDEGGFVENFYRAGVPYKVIGRARGAMLDSYIMPDSTGNGALFSPATVGAAAGFATSRGQELLLRATLATHGDAVSYCRHGVGG